MSIAELKAESVRIMSQGPVASGHANIAAAITEALFQRGMRDGRNARAATSSATAYASGYRVGKSTAAILAR